MRIGPYSLPNNLVLAPMAGVTDLPFRELCKSLGAGMAVSEMVSADTRLLDTDKGRWRIDHVGESEPRIVQIAGAEPALLAEGARFNVERGAQIVDINMGCPAKKVCNRMAGSALLADEALVAEILAATVQAVDVPVTLKIRTGPSPERRNGLTIARIAEDCGIAALSVHGRTRADAFRGQAEYDTIAAIKQAVRIPVIANGDIDRPEQARDVLHQTGVDGVMIGRAAQGNPWIFREIGYFLATGQKLAPPTLAEVRAIMLGHMRRLHDFYGEFTGLRIARKHIGWYLQDQPGGAQARQHLVRVESASAQLDLLESYFEQAAA